jgi:hypothetical protein
MRMGRTAAATRLCALAVTVAPSLGCRQIVDLRDAPPAVQTNPPPKNLGPTAGPDAGACGLPYGTAGCASCAAAHCCQESTACSKDPGCAPYAQCIGACNGDPTCRATCGASPSPPTSSEGSALTACLVAQCESKCGLTCGAPGTYGVLPAAAPRCQDCIATNGACDTARACGASATCDAVRRCAAGARTLDSLSVCWDDAPDAGAALAKSLDNSISGCATECAVGGDWACVGHVSWPAPKSDTVTFALEVVDFVSVLAGSVVGVSSVDVSICSTYDLDCLHPLQQGSTDGTGRVVLQVQNPGLECYLQVTSPDIVPSLYYMGAPAVESKVVETADSNFGAVPVFKPADLQRFFDSSGDTWDKSRGAILAHSEDCHLHWAPGVQIAISPTDAEVHVLYGMNSTATETDSFGYAFFANAPTGTVEVVATPLALGKRSSQRNVIVRPGWFTSMHLLPGP